LILTDRAFNVHFQECDARLQGARVHVEQLLLHLLPDAITDREILMYVYAQEVETHIKRALQVIGQMCDEIDGGPDAPANPLRWS
jgi:hypothetical protein